MASVTHSCLSGIPEKWTLGRERGACVSNLGKLKILICFFFSLYLKIYYYLTICFLVIYFKYSSVYVSIPNSRSIAPPDSYTLVTTSSFSSSDLAPQGSLRLVWTAVIVDFCDRGRSSSSRGREVMGWPGPLSVLLIFSAVHRRRVYIVFKYPLSGLVRRSGHSTVWWVVVLMEEQILGVFSLRFWFSGLSAWQWEKKDDSDQGIYTSHQEKHWGRRPFFMYDFSWSSSYFSYLIVANLEMLPSLLSECMQEQAFMMRQRAGGQTWL